MTAFRQIHTIFTLTVLMDAFSRDELGISPGRGCDNLRCTKCDFEVLRIPDRRWKDDAEYLFFRNFYPSLEKLQPKLLMAPGACAHVAT